MGISKKSIGKFLIGNRFHVELRILSPEILFILLQTKLKYAKTLQPILFRQVLKLLGLLLRGLF